MNHRRVLWLAAALLALVLLAAQVIAQQSASVGSALAPGSGAAPPAGEPASAIPSPKAGGADIVAVSLKDPPLVILQGTLLDVVFPGPLWHCPNYSLEPAWLDWATSDGESGTITDIGLDLIYGYGEPETCMGVAHVAAPDRDTVLTLTGYWPNQCRPMEDVYTHTATAAVRLVSGETGAGWKLQVTQSGCSLDSVTAFSGDGVAAGGSLSTGSGCDCVSAGRGEPWASEIFARSPYGYDLGTLWTRLQMDSTHALDARILVRDDIGTDNAGARYDTDVTVTTDGGASWQPCTGPVGELRIDGATGNAASGLYYMWGETAYLDSEWEPVMEQRLLTSADGVAWTQVDWPCTPLHSLVALADVTYGLTAEGKVAHVRGGAFPCGLPNSPSGLVLLDFVDAQHGWGADANGVVWRTTDAGQSWSAHPTGAVLNAMQFVSPLVGWTVGCGGTILKTLDGGVTWWRQISGVDVCLNALRFTDATHGWIVGERGLVLYTDSAGDAPATPTPTSSPSQYEYIRLEPEQGTVAAPMTTVMSDTASACAYVTSNTSASGSTTLHLTTEHSAGFSLWARAQGTDWGGNSFWVSIDSGIEFHYEIPQIDGHWDWVWSQVSENGADPHTFPLAAGSHTIRFRAREAGAALDCVWLTSAPGAAPGTHTILPCAEPTATPSATPTATPTPSVTVMPTATPTSTPTTSPTRQRVFLPMAARE